MHSTCITGGKGGNCFLSRDNLFREKIEENTPSAGSLGLRPIPSRPLDHSKEYYQQSLKHFANGSMKNGLWTQGLRSWIPLLIVVACLGAGLAYLNMHGKTAAEQPPVQASQAGTKQSLTDQLRQTAVNVLPDKLARKIKKSELSLGKAVLGMSAKELKTDLGADRGVAMEGGYKFHRYKDMQVGEKNGRVDAIVSDGPSVKTARGLHEGSSYDDVVKAYGKDCATMKLGDLVLYEYPFQDKLGRKSLLRFAVRKKDKKVDYISIRVIE